MMWAYKTMCTIPEQSNEKQYIAESLQMKNCDLKF